MHQTDFSKIKSMNIHSNVVFANQAGKNSFDEIYFDGHYAKMITTATRGVGLNRNITLLNASAEICLFADDDVVYFNDVEEKVVAEFERHPDADVIVFNFETDDVNRKQKKYTKTKKCSKFCRMPWGSIRIAFRLSSLRKANVWFSTLFGGGCVFPMGEDSMWLNDMKHKGMCFYVSKEIIGTVSFAQSTWFTGHDEKYFFGRGAYLNAVHPKTFFIWLIYTIIRTSKMDSFPVCKKIIWMFRGRQGHKKNMSFDEFKKE